MNVDTYIKKYEEETGEKVGEVVRHFAEGLLNIEARFNAKGREDGARGLPAPGMDTFTQWADKVFDDDPELAAIMADLIQMAYMHGYQEGRKNSP